MSKEAQIETIKGFIHESELKLEDMRNRVNLLNKAILGIEDGLAKEKARLQELEVKDGI